MADPTKNETEIDDNPSSNLSDQQEPAIDIISALKKSIMRRESDTTERVYQPSGLDFSNKIDIRSGDSLERIHADAGELRPRTDITMGTGPVGAKIMTISDRPKPDRVEGFIFQGRISRLESRALTQIGVDQADCYSCEVIKHICSPTHSLLDSLRNVPVEFWKNCEEFEDGESISERDYQPEDLEGYRSILLREVLVVRPSVIVVFGGLAAKMLLDTDDLVADLRNRIHRLRINDKEFSVLVTFDLTYLHLLTDRLPDFRQDLDLLKVFLDHFST